MPGWSQPDHSVILCDIGGQPERGWDPNHGHGSILRLRPDDELEVIVGPENIGGGMPMSPRRVPAHFGAWEGSIFYAGQTLPGRGGALSEHGVFVVDGDRGRLFAALPRAGKQGNGVPGALCIGGFGLEGTMMVAGLAGSSFEREAPVGNIVKYWTIANGRIDPEPVREADLGYSMIEVAPPEFGQFAGRSFLVDFGSVNLMHVTKPEPGPLPYNSRILRIDPAGNVHTFADNLQSGWNEVLFEGPRMIICSHRRSYSTGEYHEPDGSLYEIKSLS